METTERLETREREALHVPPGAGEAVWLVGDTYTLKVAGAQTGGAFTLLEAVVPAGGGPPPHIHFHEEETVVVLEGALLFTAAARTVPAPGGTVLLVSQGVPPS